MKSDKDRGEFGVWLRRVRKERFARVADAVAEMKRAEGYSITVSEWAEFEAGTRRPSAERKAALEAFLGAPAPAEPQRPTDAALAVLEAIERQTQMLERQWTVSTALVTNLTALVEEMRASREDATERDEALAEILAQLRDAALHGSTPGERAPQRGTRGRARSDIA